MVFESHHDNPMQQIADFIIRFRNLRGSRLKVRNTKWSRGILGVLESSNYLSYKIISRDLKYIEIDIISNSIRSMKLCSKGSRVMYLGYKDLLRDSRLKKTSGFYILTTSEWGLITSFEALRLGVGGKVLLKVE